MSGRAQPSSPASLGDRLRRPDGEYDNEHAQLDPRTAIHFGAHDRKPP
jgi:hypothetical protein